MLQIIDQRWREHLVEMDYLNEGIHLRGIAQTDPLVAWQREGFEMFGKLMDSIDDDYLRYVMHVQIIAAPSEDPDYAQADLRGGGRPRRRPRPAAGFATGTGQRKRRRGRQAAQPAHGGNGAPPAPAAGRPRSPDRASGPRRRGAGHGRAGADPISPTGTRIVGGPPAKVGRNDPCWCGSGRKFKVCHGAS